MGIREINGYENYKWEHDYINDIDLTKIEWIKLNADQLNEFYRENYFDKDIWQYVIDKSNVSPFPSPLGLKYLSFDCSNGDYSYLLGIVGNNFGKKTIVAAMVYLEKYYVYKEQVVPLTYISSVEVNSYFWNNGIYKKLCEVVINFINPNQHVLVSPESEMGLKYKIVDKFKKTLIENGFENSIWVDDYKNFSNFVFYNMVCNGPKKVRKK